MIRNAIRRIRHDLALRSRCRRGLALPSALGWQGLLEYGYHLWRGRRGSGFLVHPRRALHPLYIRSHSSDLDVFRQVYLDRQYAPLSGLADVRLVVDCGANTGYSSAWFLSQYPSCHVIAVEPDADNFAMLQRNLRPYGDRVKLVHAGVWPHAAPLVGSRGSYRDGRQWAVQVRPCQPGEQAEFEGVTIESLLAASGDERISLLKMDVEGAEAVIFRENVAWVDKVDTLVIELHDDTHFGKASEIFFAAVSRQEFAVAQSGELTICRRPSLTSSAAAARGA